MLRGIVLLTLLPAAGGAAAAERAVLEVFTRPGCIHCAAAREMLDALERRYPALAIVEHDVQADPAARARLVALARQHGIEQPGVPAFHAGNTLLVGYDPAGGTRTRVLAALGLARDADAGGYRLGRWLLHPDRIGLPLFSAALGLVDGFNPCSMWVLVFMLALLAPLGDRRRMLLVAGTFVVVQGIAYLAFMAAWLNLFVIVGASRTSQVLVGAAGCAIGAIHARDFFSGGNGATLAIPDSAKPGIYARMRRIVSAESALAAVIATVLLALLVQVVEFMCTAGIPALYTRILSLAGLAPWQHYAYLLIYVGCYMLDDAVVLAIGVVTLSRRRLQQRQGRWLKLLSGVVLLLLGGGLIAGAMTT